jgi:hypothetical protein
MNPPALQMLRDYLHEAGYRVLFRKRGWIECLVSSGQERWVGREATEEQALRDAMRQMFPSGAARDLLERGLSAQAEVAALAEQSDAPESAGPALSEPGGGLTPAFPDATAPDGPSAAAGSPQNASTVPDAPRAAPAPAVTAEAAPDEPSATPRSVAPRPTAQDAEPTLPESVALKTKKAPAAPETVRGGSAPPHWVPASPPEPASTPGQSTSGLDAIASTPTQRQNVVAAPSERKSHLRVKGALQAIESLVGGIDADDKRLASMSPQRLRLWVLYWICHARSYEETLPDEVDVARAVAKVAKRLTELCKRFWPGNIRALQLHARPSEAGVGGPATTWREAEAMARRLLEDHLRQGPQNGLDNDGWSDAAALLPRPADAPAMLAEMTEIVVRVTGALDAAPEFTSPPNDEVLEELAVVTQKLRWLRGCADAERWGLLMGRLRWLAQEVGSRGARLKGLLDPLHQPATSWATLFAAEGESPQQVEAVTDLLHGRPGPGTDREALAAWIVRALDVLDTAQIAMVLSPVRSEVRDLDPAQLPAPGRRVRRRFRDLVARLPDGDDTLDPPLSAPVSSIAQWSATLLASEPQAKSSGPETPGRETAERTSGPEPAERTPGREPAERAPHAPTSIPEPLSSEWASRSRPPG